MPPGIGFGRSQEIHLDPNSAKHTSTSLFVYGWSEHMDGCVLSNALRTGILPSVLPLSLPFPKEQKSLGSRLVVQPGVMVMLESISLYFCMLRTCYFGSFLSGKYMKRQMKPAIYNVQVFFMYG